MAFEDYEKVAQGEFLTLPIGGKKYAIPPVGVKDGVRLQLAVAETDEKMDKAPDADLASIDSPISNEELAGIMLSPAVLKQMRDDNVSAKAILRATLTALADHHYGRELAEIVWKHGSYPEARAASTAASGAATKPRTRTGAASTTRSRASGTTTRSRKKPAPTRAR